MLPWSMVYQACRALPVWAVGMLLTIGMACKHLIRIVSAPVILLHAVSLSSTVLRDVKQILKPFENPVTSTSMSVRRNVTRSLVEKKKTNSINFERRSK